MPINDKLKSGLIVLPLGLGSLLVFSLPLRVFESVEPRMYRVLILLVSYIIGIAAQYLLCSNLAPARVKSWMRRWAILCLGIWLVLMVLHDRWVEHGENWPKLYVVSGERTKDCKCATFAKDDRCMEAVRSNNRCIYCLSFDDADIRQCWGEQRIEYVATNLTTGYFFFGGSFGSVIGLLLLPTPPIRLFVSYRRKDSASLVLGQLAGALRDQFDDSVFIDEYSIKGGTKWRIRIRLNAETCDAFVVVIGPGWLDALKAKAAAGEEDWVKYEVETAIGRGVALVPLVFGGATVPGKKDLQGKIRELADTQAVVVSEGVLDLGGKDARVIDEVAFDKAMNELILCVLKARRRPRSDN